MIIYTKASEAFLKKVRAMSQEIFNCEICIPFTKKRVLINHIYYPLNFVCFENKNTLGFYDPKIYQIGINKSLMFKCSDEIIKNVLRHEIAHFLCHVFDGDDVKAHGPEFREKFKKYNWDPEFSKSRILIDEIIPASLNDQKILEKIEKLLKLATSKNEHEASLATQMANQLITKHNLDYNKNSPEINGADESEETCVLRVCEFTKKNTIHDGLYLVLANFNVFPVFNQGRSGGYLEVIGTRTNVTIADYITSHLQASISIIWKEAQNKDTDSLKGLSAKNSFIRSFFRTLDLKLKSENQHSFTRSQMLVLTNQLSLHVARVYPRLRSTYQSSHTAHAKANSLGSAAASSFNIKSGISNSSTKAKLLDFLK